MSRRLIPLPFAALAAIFTLVVWPAAGYATSRTQTLRFFDKQVSIKLTHANGTVVTDPQSIQPKPGDTLDIDSLDYSGTHAHHTKQWTASTHLRCTFPTPGGPPTCESHVAIGGSMLIFTGNPGTISNGTGIYQDATGRVTSAKDVKGQNDASDLVVKIKLRS